jgi:Arc/MetJ-type ribon-helix-helix transcriptional regulator
VRVQVNTTVSPETRRQIDALAAENRYQTVSTVITVAIDRMYREETMPEITAAQMIRPYVGPQYLVEPVGDVSDADDIAAINDADWVVILDRHVQGWGEYNAIVRVSANDVTADYLARL